MKKTITTEDEAQKYKKRNEIIQDEVYKTESGQKLYEMLGIIFKSSINIENVIYLLETEENRQKMIKYLKRGKRSVDDVHYYTADLRRNMSSTN